MCLKVKRDTRRQRTVQCNTLLTDLKRLNFWEMWICFANVIAVHFEKHDRHTTYQNCLDVAIKAEVLEIEGRSLIWVLLKCSSAVHITQRELTLQKQHHKHTGTNGKIIKKCWVFVALVVYLNARTLACLVFLFLSTFWFLSTFCFLSTSNVISFHRQ